MITLGGRGDDRAKREKYVEKGEEEKAEGHLEGGSSLSF
jgi:hypothetical protein